jgi:hypothetical protein
LGSPCFIRAIYANHLLLILELPSESAYHRIPAPGFKFSTSTRIHNLHWPVYTSGLTSTKAGSLRNVAKR